MNNIIKSIDQFDTKEKIYFAPKAADALAKARLGNFKLDTQRLLKGIYACGLCARDMKTFELAFWAFDILKRENAANVEAFEAMMNICSKYGRVDSSVDLMRDFFARGYVYTSYLLSTYIIILANNGTPLQVRDLLHPLYTTYKDLSKQKHFKMSSRVFMAVAECFCRLGNGEGSLTVLRDLTDIEQQPSASLCEGLLDAALSVGNTTVLRVLLSWYKVNFNVALMSGQSQRVLHIAASQGDGQLALMGFQMLRDASFEATTSDYACLLRALLLSKDLASVTEVLQEMGRQGLSFTHEVYDEWGRNSTTEVHTRQFIQFRSLLVDSIAGTREERWHRSESDLEQGRAMLDGLYYALVENARAASTEHAAGGSAPPPVPRIILDALVEAAGALNLPERAFAVFQEYEPLFKVVPDVSSYNALLAACAAQRQINISVIFSIFQEMEGKVAPNRESFDILLYAMGVCKSFEIYEQVLEHMISMNVLASRTALSNAAVNLARTGEHWKQVQLVTSLLVAQRASLPVASLTPLSEVAQIVENARLADPRKSKAGLFRIPVNLDRRLTEMKTEQETRPKGYY
eukprot:CAMPEP_0184988000 /NCGR_PEP_ID=MMETSP1098-20130426/22722_1 /TAXON_ID=89044 /ORGANISM="Spumella elongata, Strain CCAP 955/1" /LENGTH=575 /DNA_ID=CAMNT_0027512645 /DNA_START=330 /DNA_END=2057 /DNA_ORIENTATION=-